MAVQTGDILRVAAKFLWDNLHDVVNVWYLVFDDLGTITSDNDVMTAISLALDEWYTQFSGATTNNVIGDSVSGVNVTKNELLPAENLVYTGASAGEGLPLMNAPFIQWHSAVPRHGSRIYLPPIEEASQNDGILTAQRITELLGMAQDVLDGFTELTFNSNFRRVAYDRNAGIARQLETAFVPTTLRTQRRRRQGVGS